MRTSRTLLLWPAVGLLGALLLVWAYPRAFPFAPREWRINKTEAKAIALERLRDLGEPVEDAYVTAALSSDDLLERRLERALTRGERQGGHLADQVLTWLVMVYSPDALPQEWTYQALVALDGEVMLLRLRLDPNAPGAAIAAEEARARADAFLAEQGIDLALYEAPEFRSTQLAARTDLAVRYRDRRPSPSEGAKHGIQVLFAGDRLAGFSPWYDDPNERELQRELQQLGFTGIAGLVMLYVALALLAWPFLKRYHEGEIGVRRAAQIFGIALAVGLLYLALSAQASSQNVGFGFATREQTTLLFVLFYSLFGLIPTAILGFFAWAVGESICRERWGHKLAAFDALFQGELANATVARASLRGVAAGLALAGLVAAAFLPVQRVGAWPLASSMVSQSLRSRLPGLELASSYLALAMPALLATVLCLLPFAARRLGRAAGAVLAVLGTLLLTFSPGLLTLPPVWGLPAALLFAAGPVLLFLAYDLLTVLVAGFVAHVLLYGYPLLVAQDPGLQAQGWIALGLAVLPLVLSARSLGSAREFVYRYEDVPPHVRRIAERERQRVELETARGIQSSILPDLPPRLHGVDIAHVYLPATEVGGDFYDVLALEDGRLAVAVGDVAGHGVSSGLVMSMAKSALAVQVAFDPEVEPVFKTLNRMVFQTARKRMLTTLCYALLDPQRREVLYASAGHLYPYVVHRDGRVHALESTAYPLGVRNPLPVDVRTARLEPGDALFLFSDGVVEAQPEGRDEPFGFDRLEQSLARHAGDSVEQIRDGVLADVKRHVGHAPREDDQTVLVLRVP